MGSVEAQAPLAPARLRSLQVVGILSGVAAGAWLGAAEAPTKVVTLGISPVAISLVMVIGVFMARWSLPALIRGTANVGLDVRRAPHLVVWAMSYKPSTKISDLPDTMIMFKGPRPILSRYQKFWNKAFKEFDLRRLPIWLWSVSGRKPMDRLWYSSSATHEGCPRIRSHGISTRKGRSWRSTS